MTRRGNRDGAAGRAAWVLAALLCAAPACGGTGDGARDPGIADDAADADGTADHGSPADGFADDGGATVDVPALVSECSACHDLKALAAAGPGAGRTPAEWAATAADGLVRVDPLFPEPSTWWGVPWPRRGSHASAASGSCAGCHPVAADGTGHGLRVYPDPAKAFAGGTDCAPACHLWIATSTPASVFPDAAVPAVGGSVRPGDLLAASAPDHGHGLLWRQGARPADPAAFRISAFGPGCGGCHNLMAEDHGAILGCLDCHDFQSDTSAIHTAHVAAIADGQAQNDPAGAAAGLTACDYCHADAATGPGERSRRACLNCHLSAHAPLGADGQPQFWPAASAPDAGP